MLIKNLIITVVNINGKIIGHPIASKNRYSAWFNYLILYIKAKILGLRSVYCWINKLKIIIDIEDWYFARNAYLKINEFNESCFTVHFLKERIYLLISVQMSGIILFWLQEFQAVGLLP